RIHDRLAVHAELGHVDARPVDLARNAVVQRAGENARGRRLAGAAHAGENIGLVDTVDGEGIGDRPDHRLLADEFLEPLRPVFSRENAVGRGRRRERSGRRLGGKQRIAHRSLLPPDSDRSSGSIRFLGPAPTAAQNAREGEGGGWTKTRPVSLGLLPSGPDPVGERYVLRQPPGAYVDHKGSRRKRRRRLAFLPAIGKPATSAGAMPGGENPCESGKSREFRLFRPET